MFKPMAVAIVILSAIVGPTNFASAADNGRVLGQNGNWVISYDPGQNACMMVDHTQGVGFIKARTSDGRIETQMQIAGSTKPAGSKTLIAISNDKGQLALTKTFTSKGTGWAVAVLEPLDDLGFGFSSFITLDAGNGTPAKMELGEYIRAVGNLADCAREAL